MEKIKYEEPKLIIMAIDRVKLSQYGGKVVVNGADYGETSEVYALHSPGDCRDGIGITARCFAGPLDSSGPFGRCSFGLSPL